MTEKSIIVSQPPAQFPSISPAETHVWATHLNPDRIQTEELHTILSNEESLRAKKFRFSKDRTSFIHAHQFLRILLGRYLHRNPSSLLFQADEQGKPRLKDGELEFNLSHSKLMAVVAISMETPVGVDIEAIHPVLNAEAIMKRLFSPRERRLYGKAPDDERVRLFLRYWTRGEALVKARGSGFGEKVGAVSKNQITDQGTTWQIRSFFPNKDYVGAIAFQGSVQRISCWLISNSLRSIL